MSCRFYTTTAKDGADLNLWWPANTVAHVFKGRSETIAALLGVPSGIGDVIEDECEVDLAVFSAFCAEAVARYGKTTNGILRSLVVGYLATALVLLDRAGGGMPEGATPEQRTAWIALRDQHANHMAR